ncbi:MAG: hypothetical protein U9Q27_01825 [Patescibacteria group bacterium]|nr:hypothetical protein [Patescibacteria group bacterium]
METVDRRTTLVISSDIYWNIECWDDIWKGKNPYTIKQPIHRRWIVYEIGYKFHRLRFTGTFKEVCAFVESQARPFTPPIIRD